MSSGVGSPSLDDDEGEPNPNLMLEETIDRDVLYYKTFFVGKPHENYAAQAENDGGPYVLSIDAEGVAMTASQRRFKALLRTKRGDKRVSGMMQVSF